MANAVSQSGFLEYRWFGRKVIVCFSYVVTNTIKYKNILEVNVKLYARCVAKSMQRYTRNIVFIIFCIKMVGEH